ncbi:MAG: hypothetical protein ACKVU1_00780 [bacterium]
MSKEEIVAELPKLKEDLVYALQRLNPIGKMIETELAPFVPEIRTKFESVGRALEGVRVAHNGDHRTPVVFVKPAGGEVFGANADEQAVIDWFKKEITERTGVASEIEPGWAVPKAKA